MKQLRAIARDGVVECSGPELARSLGCGTTRTQRRRLQELLAAGALVRVSRHRRLVRVELAPDLNGQSTDAQRTVNGQSTDTEGGRGVATPTLLVSPVPQKKAAAAAFEIGVVSGQSTDSQRTANGQRTDTLRLVVEGSPEKLAEFWAVVVRLGGQVAGKREGDLLAAPPSADEERAIAERFTQMAQRGNPVSKDGEQAMRVRVLTDLRTKSWMLRSYLESAERRAQGEARAAELAALRPDVEAERVAAKRRQAEARAAADSEALKAWQREIASRSAARGKGPQ